MVKLSHSISYLLASGLSKFFSFDQYKIPSGALGDKEHFQTFDLSNHIL